jgi:hypothetical protein
MEMLGTVNRILDGVGNLLGSPSRMEQDARVSLDSLRCKRGTGLDSVSVSMAEISRPIMRETLIDVREEKKAKRDKARHEAAALCPQ